MLEAEQPEDRDREVARRPGSSAQQVPEPDPLPGISFDTRPDPIQF